jgi:hypothetical protein
MALTPLFSSPCDLAQRIPALISDFLELENKVGRRFREDSLTDIIVASMLQIVGSNATVLTPSEKVAGSDFDILIVEPATGAAVQYRLQAKRLSPHHSQWDWGSYKELAHPHGSGAQASTLVRSSAHEAIPTMPLYAFYNPASVCQASGGRLSGLELADGRQINEIVKALLKAKPKRPRLKRVAHLHDLFFPLSTLLCSADDSTVPATVIAPEQSRQAVLHAMESRRPSWLREKQIPVLEAPQRHLPSLPVDRLPDRVVSDIRPSLRAPRPRRRYPKVVEDALRTEGPPVRKARVRRTKLILVSEPRGE